MSHYRMCNHKTGIFIKLRCFYKPTYPALPMKSHAQLELFVDKYSVLTLFSISYMYIVHAIPL